MSAFFGMSERFVAADVIDLWATAFISIIVPDPNSTLQQCLILLSVMLCHRSPRVPHPKPREAYLRERKTCRCRVKL